MKLTARVQCSPEVSVDVAVHEGKVWLDMYCDGEKDAAARLMLSPAAARELAAALVAAADLHKGEAP